MKTARPEAESARGFYHEWGSPRRTVGPCVFARRTLADPSANPYNRPTREITEKAQAHED